MITRLSDPLPVPVLPCGVSRRKVLLLGLDGLRPDLLVTAPTLARLVAEGSFAVSPLYCSPAGVTGSGAGWATVLSGVWPDRNNVRDGNMISQRARRYPDLLSRAKAHDPALSTLSMAAWTAVNSREWYGGPLVSDAVDVRLSFDADSDDPDQVDAAIAEVLIRVLTEQDPDALFVHFGSIDLAGHSGGASLPRYRAALIAVDGHISRALEALASRSPQEEWLVLVTNDHGHRDRGTTHNGPSAAERGWSLLACGPGIPAGVARPDVRAVDVLPTFLHHLGVPVDPAWGLDGRALQEAVPADDFDSLVPLLDPPFDQVSIPRGTCGGSTFVPPEGWQTDGGWRFVTDPYWTAQARQQGREAFTHARGVFAVASSDATLASPAYDVSGPVTVTFAAQYRQHGDGRATLTAAFDGGAERELLTYGPAVHDRNHGTDLANHRERVVVASPPDASTMVLRWRLVTRGSGWLAIDAVRVHHEVRAPLAVTLSTSLPNPGETVHVRATLDGELTCDLPWPVKRIADGEWLLMVPADAVPGPCVISVAAGAEVCDLPLAVPHSDVNAARDWIVTGPEGNADGEGRTWPAEALTRADAVLCSGQGILLSGSGERLSLLASSAFFPGGGQGVIAYEDGTRQPYDIFIPVWDDPDPPHPVAIDGRGRKIYRIDIPLHAGRPVAGIILPRCSDKPVSYAPSPYVFDAVIS
ncbi:alkaline phosphatase family protein [Nonomuraea sp. NPDC050556]|uniref:alkaline phosphatase family protein n=1 Tax=Nonomuraea sp. NPDC050556 TaxID=3364369 RepID=UPI003795CE2B